MPNKTEQITIILPVPPKILSPNRPPASRGGRIGKAKKTKEYRALACRAVEEEQLETTPWERANVDVTFFHRYRRRRDPDNAMGSLKAAYDGFIDAGLLPDDDSLHMTRGEPSFKVDKEYPRVMFTITREPCDESPKRQKEH